MIAVMLSLPMVTCMAQLISRSEVESHVRFLASDELKGRQVGEMGADVAASYIAEQLRKYGIKPISDDGYLQRIPFKQVSPPDSAQLRIGDSLSIDLSNLIVLSRLMDRLQGQVVFVDFASDEDLASLDVAGKIVLSRLGSPTSSGAQEAFQHAGVKRARMIELGAKALVEWYQDRLPWNLIKNYLGQARTVIAGDTSRGKLTHLVINADLNSTLQQLADRDSLPGSIFISGGYERATPSSNVVGFLEGSDPNLKDQHVVVTAHYDHVGTRVQPDRPQTNFDSVFNGARDNAFGVAAILTAAKILAEDPPKRSVLFVAFTAEEIGLLGSQYFVDHPIIPLNQMVFNLNTDGAGYSDTSLISIMGLNRVGATAELTAACEAFGFEAFADPAPGQGLFDRSDNVSFARVGIPAPTFSPGFRDFDQNILKNYHQPSDESDTLDFGYVHRFCQAFAKAARLVADMEQQPRWSAGDKYEEAFQQLFGL